MIDARRLLILVGGGLALAAGAFALAGQVGDFGHMLDAVRRLEWRWLALCAAGELLAYAGYALAFREVARLGDGPQLSFGQAARVTAIGFGAYVLGSAAGGAAVEAWALKRGGVEGRAVARRLLGFKTLEWGVLALGAAAAAAAVLAVRPEDVPAELAWAWIAAVAVGVPAVAWLAWRGHAERLSRGSWDDAGALGKVREGVADALGGLEHVRPLALRPLAVPAIALHWAGLVLVLYAAARALGIDLHVAGLVLAFATGYAATALPLPAGGTGGIELALASAMRALGAAFGAAFVAALVFRFVTFWLPIPLALALAITGKDLHEELPET